MEPRDPFVEALRWLAAHTEGGLSAVAERAGISEENLKQVLAGTRLGSGRPRGLGPNVRNRLDEAFPGWWQRATGAAQLPHEAPKAISDTLLDLAAHLVMSDDLTRKAVTPLLDRLVSNPEEASRIAPRVEALLAAEPPAPYSTNAASELARETAERNTAIERARRLKEPASAPRVAPAGGEAAAPNQPPERH